MLRTFHMQELSRKLRGMKLNADSLWQLLMSRGLGTGVALAQLTTGHFVIRVINQAGRAVRGYGKTVTDALRYLMYQLLCATGDC